MTRRAIFAAKLLAGEMPQTIEEVFTASGLSLFPFSKFDIHSHCSCPDPVNPCKHIGAVYYLLGDYFSRDPFILFQLRGRTQQQIIAALRQMRSTHTPTEATPAAASPSLPPRTPLRLDHQFWHYEAQLDPSLVVIAPPPSSETILDVLGPIPLESDSGTPENSAAVMAYLAQIYQQVSQRALMSAMTSGENGAAS